MTASDPKGKRAESAADAVLDGLRTALGKDSTGGLYFEEGEKGLFDEFLTGIREFPCSSGDETVRRNRV
jgi:hypothetical protein